MIWITMNKLLVSLLLLFFVGAIYADEFSIVGKKLEIPSPQGYLPITKKMDAVYRLSQQMTDPSNTQLAFYINESMISTALANEMPALDRYFILKINNRLKETLIKSKHFIELKDVLKKQNKKIFESLKTKMPAHMDGISKGVSKEFDVDFAIKVSKMVPFDPHYETDNALAYSLLINYRGTVGGDKDNMIVSATSTFLNLEGRVLLLFCYGAKDDIEWTREASKKWVEAILSEFKKTKSKD